MSVYGGGHFPGTEGNKKWERNCQPSSSGISNFFDQSPQQNLKSVLYTVTQSALSLVSTHIHTREKQTCTNELIHTVCDASWSLLFSFDTDQVLLRLHPRIHRRPSVCLLWGVCCLGCLDRVNDSREYPYVIWCSG